MLETKSLGKGTWKHTMLGSSGAYHYPLINKFSKRRMKIHLRSKLLFTPTK